MRAWGGVGTRVPVPAPIPVQICGQLPVPKPIPNNAGIYPPAMGIFCGCPSSLGPIAIPSEWCLHVARCRYIRYKIVLLPTPSWHDWW